MTKNLVYCAMLDLLRFMEFSSSWSDELLPHHVCSMQILLSYRWNHVILQLQSVLGGVVKGAVQWLYDSFFRVEISPVHSLSWADMGTCPTNIMRVTPPVGWSDQLWWLWPLWATPPPPSSQSETLPDVISTSVCSQSSPAGPHHLPPLTLCSCLTEFITGL